MSNAVQIAKIVEAALLGDTTKVKNYAALIAEHFDQDGDNRAARIVRRSYGAEPAGRPVALDNMSKGAFGGLCNRSACLRPGADWHNIATNAHYCRECAELINYPGGRADALRLFGRELLCMPAAGPGEAGWFSPLVFDSAAEYDASVARNIERIKSGEVKQRFCQCSFAMIMRGEDDLPYCAQCRLLIEEELPAGAAPTTTGEGKEGETP